MWENFKAAFLTQNEIWPPEIRERERERAREREKWSKPAKIRDEFQMSSTCAFDEWIATLHLTIWLLWTAKCGSLVYSRIVSLSQCYIISQITWEWWRSSMLLHLQIKMEAWLPAGIADCRPPYQRSRRLNVWLSFLRMEFNTAKSSGWQSSISNLKKRLF